ncbi:PREDICTED: armadillo repeat protein deleted in velo-cardio-facial syndrome isoform X5 [Propithecus coquereli]|uniref:armadillo repeat protein deleted in velo-cardio-facial syndrome isoform X5 n=1 Tax=Propithecus coquereli TaxID=379532 RepID=UPI00063F0A8E|nr:PREDICTED: armadillo repeat protein deleted in velo-cardio-facial syndrome isoform X5 [Propithecus coquereli]
MPAELRQEQSPGSQASLAAMPEAPEVLEETVTVEEDPGTPTSHVSIVTSEDGTTRRTETKVTKTVKTVTTRTVRQVPLGPDGLPLLDGGPPLGPFADGPLDRHFLLRGGGPAATLSRAYLSSGGGFPDGPDPRDGPSYGSLSRGLVVRPPRTGPLGPGPADGCFTLPGRRESFPVGPEPGPPGGRSLPERFQAEPYGLEDDTRSLAADDEGGPELEPDYGTATRRRPECGRGLRTRAHEDVADDGGELLDERPAFPAVTAPLAQPERGSLGSLDRLARRSPSVDSTRKEPRWRDPELPEVLAMLRHPVDPVKANAAAYLQHLCFENEGVKRRVRQLRGLPLLVALLDHPRAEVRRRACGALRNLSYGRDTDNKAAIRDCGGVPALVRLLRSARDSEVRELVTGTLWNLSSYEPLKMVIIDHGLQTLTHEVIVPHSGWELEPNEDSKPRDAEWTTVFKNTSGCLRNVSSDGAEARRRLRECEGLVDALLHALQSAVSRKDTDNKGRRMVSWTRTLTRWTSLREPRLPRALSCCTSPRWYVSTSPSSPRAGTSTLSRRLLAPCRTSARATGCGPPTSGPPCARSVGSRCLWNCCSLRPTRWCAPSPSLCATSRWTGATRTSLGATPWQSWCATFVMRRRRRDPGPAWRRTRWWLCLTPSTRSCPTAWTTRARCCRPAVSLHSWPSSPPASLCGRRRPRRMCCRRYGATRSCVALCRGTAGLKRASSQQLLLLLLLRDPRGLRALGALMIARCPWWTRALTARKQAAETGSPWMHLAQWTGGSGGLGAVALQEKPLRRSL